MKGAREVYKTLPGMHLHPRERELLRSLAKRAGIEFGPDFLIVNIGIAAGYGAASMHALRAGSDFATIIGIDIEDQGDLPDTLVGYAGLSRYITADSGEMSPFTNIAVLFIDGDHTYRGVKADIENWASEVMPGGFMAFHDYGQRQGPGFEHCRGVKKAVDEWIDSPGVDEQWVIGGDVESVRWFRRQKWS